MALRKHTQLRRRSVDQTGRIIVPKEPNAPSPKHPRRITLTLPETPGVALALGPYEAIEGDLPGVDDAGALPEDVAEGRAFQWAELDAGRDYVLVILPDQWISALATEGYAKIAVTIEYLEPGDV